MHIFHTIAARLRLAVGRLFEIITGRSCETCDHYAKGSCWHPDFDTRDDCMTSLRPIGYKQRGLYVEPMELTPEQEHQMAKIMDVLQEAEDTARESGLLED